MLHSPALRCHAALPLHDGAILPLAALQQGLGRSPGKISSSLRYAGYSAAAVACISRLACRRKRQRAALLAYPRPCTEDPDGLIAAAKRYFSLGNEVVQQLGPTRKEDLEKELAADFEFVAPLVGPLGKDALIAATGGLNINSALPNFDARYHAFRMDPENPRRVWCQMRVCGTQTGELKFANVTVPPKSPPIRVENPPEAVSITFNEDGKVREITTGYPVDRLCGTTNGLGGIFGVLEGLGNPLPVPLTRSCSEILSPILSFLRLEGEWPAMNLPVLSQAESLPEERLLELAEQLIESRFGVDNSSLLADGFISTGPFGAPLSKDQFLEAASTTNVSEAFPDIDYQWRDLRICPFDVNRVWFTSSPVGTHSSDLRFRGEILPATGKRWCSPPECGSAIFNGEGKCVYLTSGYIMDRRMGNTNGLAGIFGLREAIGQPSPSAWLSRTPVQLWSSLTGGS